MSSDPIRPPAEVRPAETPKQLAAIANKAFRQGTDSLRVAGEALLKAKGQIGHGNWLAWLEENWEFSPRHARRAMRTVRRSTPEQVIDAVCEPDDGEDETPKRPSRSVLTTHEIDQSNEPVQTSVPRPTPFSPPPPPPPVPSGSPWTMPTTRNGNPSQMTDEKRTEWIEANVPPPDGPTFAEQVATAGPDWRSLADGAHTATVGARRLYEDLETLGRLYGPGSPDRALVRPILDGLEFVRRDCERRAAEGGGS